MKEKNRQGLVQVQLGAEDLAPNALRETVERLSAIEPHDWTREISNEDSPTVIYGAGDFGDFALRYMEQYGLKVEFVADSDFDRAKRLALSHGLQALDINSLDFKKRSKTQILVTIALVPFSEVFASLKSKGFNHVVPFYQFLNLRVPEGVLQNGWTIDITNSVVAQDIDYTVSSLNESLSVAHYLRFTMWHSTGIDVFYEDGLGLTERYFIQPVMECLDRRQRIVDVGCHHGMFVKRFLELVGGVEAALLIDGDRESSDKCLQHFESDSRIKVLNRVVWSTCGPVSFRSGLHYSSQVVVSGTGGEVEPVSCTIDELGTKCDLLKVHVEGGELEILKGAKKTIDENRPLIFATTYHNQDGVAKTQRFILENFEDYVILQRAHAWCGTGQVLYGFPKERRESVGSGHR